MEEEKKPRYYMQDINNYTREHLINIIIFLDGELKKFEEKEDLELGTEYDLNIGKENFTKRQLEIINNIISVKVKESNIKLLDELSNQFQPDVRTDVILPTNLEEWINNKYKKMGNEIKDKWQTDLSNNERIEILFMKVQELEERINKQEIETDLLQDINQDLKLDKTINKNEKRK